MNIQSAKTIRRIACVFIGGLLGSFAPDAASQTRQSTFAGHEHAGLIGQDLWTRDHLLGDPGGYRSRLESQGITLDAVLIADLSKNISGGENADGVYRHLFEFAINWDLQPLTGIEGGSFFSNFLTRHGENGSQDTGDLQIYANWDAPNFTALYEIWYQQELFDGLLRLKAGKFDANTEFAFVDHGGGFIHSSAGFSPTVFVLPTYPDSAFGGAVFIGESGGLYASAGLFEGALQEGFSTGKRGPSTLFGSPADLFLIGEVGYAWNEQHPLLPKLFTDLLPGRLAGGVWHHTGDFTRFDGGTDSNTTGLYLVYDQQLHKESQALDDRQGVYLFAQLGYADSQLAIIDRHVGLGVSWVGAIPGRDHDAFGAMVSYAGLTDQPGSGITDDHETAFEVFYKAQLTLWLFVRPDIQYIANPGGAGLDDAMVCTLRIEMVF